MSDRPVIRCFIAKPKGAYGDIERSKMTDLAEGLTAMEAGWYVVGPDPEDVEALAIWEREHADPFNTPRIE